MIGQSQALLAVDALIGKIARYDASVVIEGETGTGKELAARAIHYRSARRAGPFVPLNCGAIPDHLMENELFGHRRGAYTDARDDQPGVVALAVAGTLFLDEIDMLSPKGQVTLLRFLQDQQFRPLGAREAQQGDVRVIAASNRSLDAQAAAGEFRSDLLYRLKLLHLRLPPLRERPGDAELLAHHFVGKASVRFSKPALPLSKSTIAWLDRYHWPGNVRELENLVSREFLLAEGGEIAIAPLDGANAAVTPQAGEARLNYRWAKQAAIDEFESHFLARLIEHANGNVSVAARMSGTERRHLGRLLKKYRISRILPQPPQ